MGDLETNKNPVDVETNVSDCSLIFMLKIMTLNEYCLIKYICLFIKASVVLSALGKQAFVTESTKQSLAIRYMGPGPASTTDSR